MSVSDQWKLIDTDGFTRSSVKQVHYKYIKIHSGSYQFEHNTGKREPIKFIRGPTLLSALFLLFAYVFSLKVTQFSTLFFLVLDLQS